MIDQFILEKLLYKKGKNIFINQSKAVEFLTDESEDIQTKFKFLDYIKILEDYNALNMLLKNFSKFDSKLKEKIIFIIDGIPFSKIESNIIKLINHRDINIRIHTLSALKNCNNPKLLPLIEPFLSNTNQHIKILALTAYYKIVYNNTLNEISLGLSNEDEDIKKESYKCLIDITKLHKEIDELKNITYFDQNLEKLEKEIKNNNSNNHLPDVENIDLNKLLSSVSKIEKSSNYSFISMLSVSTLLIITIFFNYYNYNKTTDFKQNFKPVRKISFAPDTIKSREAVEKAFAELEKGNLDTAERQFELVNDSNIKNFQLFKINMKKKNYEKAAFYFLNLSKYSSDDLDEYIFLANQINTTGELNLAIEILEKLLFFNSLKINNMLLDLYEKLDFEKALYFNKLYNLNNIKLIQKAAKYYEAIDYEKSIEYYLKLYSFSINYNQKEQYLKSIISLNRKHKKYNELKELLKKELIRYPDSLTILDNLKIEEIRDFNYIEAIELIDRLIILNPQKINQYYYEKTKLLNIIDKNKSIEFYNSINDKISEEFKDSFEIILKRKN